jgi:prepilin-type N-terminal cleavage/methylation domain-containing protein
MTPFSRRVRAPHRGFTLIELLTVIAIIAILAALLFPVFAQVREQMRQTSCSSNIHAIIQGLQMYKDDWKVYPEALYGLQYFDPDGNPISEFEGRLFPAYVKSNNTFNCPNSYIKVSDSPGLVQAMNMMGTGNGAEPAMWRRGLYRLRDFSSYDHQQIPNNGTPLRTELHYRLKWSPGAGGLMDDQRQLFYRNPPDSTVVTWCLYHAGMNNSGVPQKDGIAIVGFLSGNVKKIQATRLLDWGASTQVYPWQVSPNVK